MIDYGLICGQRTENIERQQVTIEKNKNNRSAKLKNQCSFVFKF